MQLDCYNSMYKTANLKNFVPKVNHFYTYPTISSITNTTIIGTILLCRLENISSNNCAMLNSYTVLNVYSKGINGTTIRPHCWHHCWLAKCCRQNNFRA